jgi:hypothetical protein
LRTTALLASLLAVLLLADTPLLAAQEASPVASASPVALATEMLFLTSVPVGLPTGSQHEWELTHFTIPPDAPPAQLVGGTWDASIGACCPGLRVEYVLAGAYRVKTGGPATLLRDGAPSPEAIAAGTDVILGPGDALFSRSEDAFEATNPGSEPAELLTSVMTTHWSTTTSTPTGWDAHDVDGAYGPDGPTLPAEPVALRLRQVSLAPQTTVPPLPNTLGQVAVTVEANASLGKQADGALRNIGDVPVTAYLLTLEPAGTNVIASPTP